MNQINKNSKIIVGIALVVILAFWYSQYGKKADIIVSSPEVIKKAEISEQKQKELFIEAPLPRKTIFASISGIFKSLKTKSVPQINPEVKQEEEQNKEVDMYKKAEFRYKNLFYRPKSMVGYEMTRELKAGEAIYAENFWDAKVQPTWYIPLISPSGRIEALSIFRDYGEEMGGIKSGSMGRVAGKWYSFPPVSAYDAKTELIKNYPNLDIIDHSGFYYAEVPNEPSYLFEGNDGKKNRYYLISAFTKYVEVREDRVKPKEEEEKKSVKMLDKDGLIVLNEELTLANGFSEFEVAQIKSEFKLLNVFIKEGKVKFDKDFNIIFDKRTESERDQQAYAYFNPEGYTEDAETNNAPPPTKVDVNMENRNNNQTNPFK